MKKIFITILILFIGTLIYGITAEALGHGIFTTLISIGIILITFKLWTKKIDNKKNRLIENIKGIKEDPIVLLIFVCLIFVLTAMFFI